MDNHERDNMYIANCKACTLAPIMRLCNICRFQIGLAFKIVQAQEALSADCVLRIEEIRERFLAEINLYDCEKC